MTKDSENLAHVLLTLYPRPRYQVEKHPELVLEQVHFGEISGPDSKAPLYRSPKYYRGSCCKNWLLSEHGREATQAANSH